MKKDKSIEYSLEINVSDKNESFYYNENSDLSYNELKYYVFTEATIEELNEYYPIKYIKKKNNIYYTIYSLKNHKLCYIIFKEKEGILRIDYSWVYSENMIEANDILNIEIGTNYIMLDSIDNNMIKIDEMSSDYFTIHFFKDGTSAMLKIDKDGNISNIISRDNNIYDYIYEIDYSEKIMN